MEIDPTEMSQGENDYEEVQRLFDQEVFRCREMLSDAQKSIFFFSSACISRVPKELRKLKESAYTPRLIAIGPLHRNDPHLQTPMQHVKSSYANNLLRRLTEGEENLELAKQKEFRMLGECMVAMKKSLDDAKKCYSDEVWMDAKMMLIDGCFILELLYRFCLYSTIGIEGDPIFANALTIQSDPIFANALTIQSVLHDLVLLENQIPFFVLEKLYPLTLARIHNNMSLTDFVVLLKDAFIWSTGERDSTTSRDRNDMMKNSRHEEVSSHNRNYHHILHAIQDDFFPSYNYDTITEGYLIWGKVNPSKKKTGKEVVPGLIMPSASDLAYAVKFAPGWESGGLNPRFIEPVGLFSFVRMARFEIPYLEINELTEPLLRNLIAFEQCCPAISQHITSYACFMDMVMNSDKDVEVLEMAGVVRNHLSTGEEATHLFSKLCNEVYFEEFYYAPVCYRAIRYSQHWFRRTVANIRRKFLVYPWASIAFCLAFVSSAVTIAQFILSFFPVFNSK